MTNYREILRLQALGQSQRSVYAAQTATAARAFCPPSPVTAHGHCPANYDILGMARQ